MASINLQKHTTHSGGAMIAHFERHDDRENVDYSNKDIHPEITPLNVVVTYKETDKGPRLTVKHWEEREAAREARHRLTQRLKEIDRILPPSRVRKDRKTIVTCTVPAPLGLSGVETYEFFAKVYDMFVNKCGGRENCTEGIIHFDEVHDYIDHGQKVSSRPHLHAAGLMFVPEKGINGKQFITRDFLRKINRDIDTMCREKFGIPFMTGEEARGETVEHLKAESLKAEIEERTKQIEDIESAQERVGRTWTGKLKGKVTIPSKEYLWLVSSIKEAREKKLTAGLYETLRKAYEKKNKALMERQKALDKEVAAKVAEGIRQEQEALERQRDRLTDRKEDLEIREAGLDRREADLDRRSQDLDRAEDELREWRQEIKNVACEHLPEEEVRRLFPERFISRGHSR